MRTRSTLVDKAAELCLRQGYDHTTVEQIAEAAEVSPRTFSRYFPTKDAVIMAIVEDVAQFVAAELAAQPRGITEYEALLRAHLASMSSHFSRHAALIQIVNSSANLAMSTIPFRADPDRFPTVVETAKRMGLPVDHDAVHLVIDSWTAVMNTACHGLGRPGQPPIELDVVLSRVRTAYELFTKTWQPWEAASQSIQQPPAGAPGG